MVQHPPDRLFKDTDYKYRHEIILTLFLQLTGMLFFTLVFNLCNDLQYGLWASTSLLSFVFVSLFIQSYRLFLAIPEPIYTLWKFDDSGSVDAYSGIDFGRLKVVTLEIYKEDGNREALRLGNAQTRLALRFACTIFDCGLDRRRLGIIK